MKLTGLILEAIIVFTVMGAEASYRCYLQPSENLQSAHFSMDQELSMERSPESLVWVVSGKNLGKCIVKVYSADYSPGGSLDNGQIAATAIQHPASTCKIFDAIVQWSGNAQAVKTGAAVVLTSHNFEVSYGRGIYRCQNKSQFER